MSTPKRGRVTKAILAEWAELFGGWLERRRVDFASAEQVGALGDGQRSHAGVGAGFGRFPLTTCTL